MTSQFVNSQVAEKVYFFRGHNYSSVGGYYYVSEFSLISDSACVINIYKVPDNKEWENYKNYEPEKFEGQVAKCDRFYCLTELRNGEKTNITEYLKISDTKVSFYHKFDKVYSKFYMMKRLR